LYDDEVLGSVYVLGMHVGSADGCSIHR